MIKSIFSYHLFSQLQELKSFLKDAAEKERTARGKLEKFIGELITRAERAESELKSLKSQSSSTLGGTDNHKEVEKYHITKTCSYNVYPLEPHIYIAKLGYAGGNLLFLFLFSLEPPRRGGSDMYPQSMF